MAVFRQRSKRGDFGPSGVGRTLTTVLLLVFVVPLLLVALGIFGRVLVPLMQVMASDGAVMVSLAIGGVGAGLVTLLLVVGSIKAVAGARRRRQRLASLAQFAEDNQLRFRLRSANPQYPGCLFSLGVTGRR